MSFHFAAIARAAAADAQIAEAEILALRQAGWADGRFTREEAEALFAAHHASADHCHGWCDFFSEAIRQYVLSGGVPRGHVGDAEADWLIAQVMADGAVCSLVELELLVSLIERASNSPQRFKEFVLDVIERAVLTGEGPTRCGGALAACHITEAECRLIRRVIFAAGGDRPAAVSLAEAEMLFRIKDASLEAANAPEFERLFVQGVANALMGFSSANAQLSAERAAQLEAFLADRKHGVGRFLGAMAKAAPAALHVVLSRRKPRGPSRAEQVASAAAITDHERNWLERQMAANGALDRYERALIAFLAEEAG